MQLQLEERLNIQRESFQPSATETDERQAVRDCHFAQVASWHDELRSLDVVAPVTTIVRQPAPRGRTGLPDEVQGDAALNSAPSNSSGQGLPCSERSCWDVERAAAASLTVVQTVVLSQVRQSAGEQERAGELASQCAEAARLLATLADRTQELERHLALRRQWVERERALALRERSLERLEESLAKRLDQLEAWCTELRGETQRLTDERARLKQTAGQHESQQRRITVQHSGPPAGLRHSAPSGGGPMQGTSQGRRAAEQHALPSRFHVTASKSTRHEAADGSPERCEQPSALDMPQPFAGLIDRLVEHHQRKSKRWYMFWR
jgi:hypothetical protein